jgi:Xaa-Pro dipeptidase
MVDAEMNTELQEKLERIRRLLAKKNVHGILLSSLASFSWLCGGRGHIGLASEQACGKFLVTPSDCYLLINNIEAERIEREELRVSGVHVVSFPWYQPEDEQAIIKRLMQDRQWITEQQLAGEVARLRWELTSPEMERYREAGRAVAKALEQTCMEIKRSETEFQIAARLAAHCLEAGIDPILQLVAVDERAAQFRHPVPTNKRLDRYAMVVVGGRKHGLVVSATRCVHLGPLPDDLARRHRDAAFLDAELIAKTRPGVRVQDLFAHLQRRYHELGFSQEWTRHHQGGLTGYVSREYRASDRSDEIVRVNQAFAWNPTIRGTKSEDTILIRESVNEIITETGEWPLLEFSIEGIPIRRPAILVL